jgi:hypothetical protein
MQAGRIPFIFFSHSVHRLFQPPRHKSTKKYKN